MGSVSLEFMSIIRLVVMEMYVEVLEMANSQYLLIWLRSNSKLTTVEFSRELTPSVRV